MTIGELLQYPEKQRLMVESQAVAIRCSGIKPLNPPTKKYSVIVYPRIPLDEGYLKAYIAGDNAGC